MDYKRWLEDTNLLHEGVEENRSYYVPYFEKKPSCVTKRSESDRLMMLSGKDWGFAWYGSADCIPGDPATVQEDFVPMDVPSLWQTRGYDKHNYTNVRFQIPYDPPYVPDENPCSLYVKRFTLDKTEDFSYYLNFEGVDSAYFVWVNGAYVGYSSIPHSTSEFDITDKLLSGDNELRVLVFKYSCGTYAEDQDKFRMTGIFRDVYILKRPLRHVRDFTVRTTLTGEGATVDVTVDCPADLYVGYTLSFKGDIVGYGKVTDGKFSIALQQPELWTAETPKSFCRHRLRTRQDKLLQ